jgi:serine/threonine-protein kinase
MLTTQLAHLRGMRVLSDSRVEQFLERGHIEGRGVAVAARRAGATDLVSGNLYRAKGGQLRLDLQRIDLRSGAVRALPSVEGTDVSVLTRLAIVHLAAAPADSAKHAASASVAVLPFLDVSPDQKAEYLADGVSIDLMSALGRVPGLWVASRRASFRYRDVTSGVQEVGRDLGVRYLLEGSVSKEDDRLRINLQLVDAADGHLRWAQSFAGRKSEIFSLQDQVERTAVETLRQQLRLPAPGDAPRRPRDPAAYDAYLRGRFLLRDRTHERVRKAIEYFSRAAARDPEYALAYAGLADAYVSLAAFECPDSVLPRARVAIDRALALDDALAGMHLARANILLHFDWQWEAAEREHRRALQLDPDLAEAHFGYASFLRAARRPDEALREVRQAMALKQAASPDTLAFAVVRYRKLGEFLYYAGRYDEARAQARASLDLDPGSVQTQLLLALIDVQDGEPARAAAEAEAVRGQIGDRPSELADLGYIFARAGRTDEARAILDTLQALARTRYVPRDEMAIVHLGLGETELALDQFESAIADRHWWLVYLNADPRLDPLRAHPRFQRLMRRIHAPA